MGRESGMETRICSGGKINNRNVIMCLKVYFCKNSKESPYQSGLFLLYIYKISVVFFAEIRLKLGYSNTNFTKLYFSLIFVT